MMRLTHPATHTRRGLTLIEVLCATVLLAMLGATCVPLIQRANDLQREDSTEDVSRIELRDRIDAIMADSELAEQLNSNAETTFQWPEHAERSIAAAVHEAEDDDHRWIIFSCGDKQVIRFQRLETDEEADE